MKRTLIGIFISSFILVGCNQSDFLDDESMSDYTQTQQNYSRSGETFDSSTNDSIPVPLLKGEDDNVLVAKGRKLKEKYNQYFNGLRYAAQTVKINPNVSNPQCSYISSFDFTSLKKWMNPDTGILYIYDTTNKVALSLYTDADWLQDENVYVYGLGDFIYSKVPDIDILLNTMARSYKIYGL